MDQHANNPANVLHVTGTASESLDAALLASAMLLVASGDELERIVHAAERLGVVAHYRLLIRTHRLGSRGLTPDEAINRLSRFTGVRVLRFVGFAAAEEDRDAPELAALLARAGFLGHADDLRVMP
ncbi:MAG: hypothetical protein HEQ23_07595 [Tepidisphaera sp.]